MRTCHEKPKEREADLEILAAQKILATLVFSKKARRVPEIVQKPSLGWEYARADRVKVRDEIVKTPEARPELLKWLFSTVEPIQYRKAFDHVHMDKKGSSSQQKEGEILNRFKLLSKPLTDPELTSTMDKSTQAELWFYELLHRLEHFDRDHGLGKSLPTIFPLRSLAGQMGGGDYVFWGPILPLHLKILAREMVNQKWFAPNNHNAGNACGIYNYSLPGAQSSSSSSLLSTIRDSSTKRALLLDPLPPDLFSYDKARSILDGIELNSAAVALQGLFLSAASQNSHQEMKFEFPPRSPVLLAKVLEDSSSTSGDTKTSLDTAKKGDKEISDKSDDHPHFLLSIVNSDVPVPGDVNMGHITLLLHIVDLEMVPSFCQFL